MQRLRVPATVTGWHVARGLSREQRYGYSCRLSRPPMRRCAWTDPAPDSNVAGGRDDPPSVSLLPALDVLSVQDRRVDEDIELDGGP